MIDVYALVCWSLTDNVKPRKNFFTYKTELKNLKKGDAVFLETITGEERMGVFVKYLEKDSNPGNLKRIDILKKVHTNTLKARIRKRYEEFKNYKLPTYSKAQKKRLKSWIKRIQQHLNITNETLKNNQHYLHWKIMRVICFGNRVNLLDGKVAIFYYKNKAVRLHATDNGWELNNVYSLGRKISWVRPAKSHQILVELFKNEKEPRLKLYNEQ